MRSRLDKKLVGGGGFIRLGSRLFLLVDLRLRLDLHLSSGQACVGFAIGMTIAVAVTIAVTVHLRGIAGA